MWLMLLVLFVWLVPQQVSADDGYETFVDQTILYNVFVSGSNTVTITVPCYDMEGADAFTMVISMPHVRGNHTLTSSTGPLMKTLTTPGAPVLSCSTLRLPAT